MAIAEIEMFAIHDIVLPHHVHRFSRMIRNTWKPNENIATTRKDMKYADPPSQDRRRGKYVRAQSAISKKAAAFDFLVFALAAILDVSSSMVSGVGYILRQ